MSTNSKTKQDRQALAAAISAMQAHTDTCTRAADTCTRAANTCINNAETTKHYNSLIAGAVTRINTTLPHMQTIARTCRLCLYINLTASLIFILLHILFA